ncbi:hypothetical protein [Chryseobacterium aurantiacum]|uniref:hypothetical protein n=1 Tax=Chryseobacterium aurantiacum TaxID=2116499 RepID=UPI000D13262E|nr:hypothetical protein [Chryseobacterium aurantiacum]
MEVINNRGKIEEIIDRTLNFWIENDLNKLPCDIEPRISLMKNGNHGFLLKVPLQIPNFKNLKKKPDLFSQMILKYF